MKRSLNLLLFQIRISVEIGKHEQHEHILYRQHAGNKFRIMTVAAN